MQGFSLEEIHSIFSSYYDQNENLKSMLIPVRTGQGRLINLKSLSGGGL